MNILITGSTGFIGSNIAQKLVTKNKLFIVVRNKKIFYLNIKNKCNKF